MPTRPHPGRGTRSFRSESGSILILTALSIILLLGIAAFAVDGSFMYTERNRMHAAADAAAKSGAWELYRGSGANLQAYANREVVLHGFTPSPGGNTDVTVYSPPSTGRFAGQNGYVEVFVDRDTPTFFGTILGYLNLRPGARAVAGQSSGPNCIVALQTTGTSMTIGNTVDVNLPGCNIQSNGNLNHRTGGGTINAAAVGAASCTGDCVGITTPSPPIADPLANLSDPPLANPYSSSVAFSLPPSGPASAVLNPGWYSSIDIANNKNVTFNSGYYWISGPITIGNSAVIRGTGVTFYLAGTSGPVACTQSPLAPAGCINIPNGADVALSAPTSGPLTAILFFQSRSNQIAANFDNAGSYNLSGAMYFPAATVTYGNSGANNDCTLFVANVVNLSPLGGGRTSITFANTCSAYGGSPLKTVTLAE